jgi:hypothetical protein
VLAVISYKLHDRQSRAWDICWGGPGKRPSTPKTEYVETWTWPKKWSRVARSGDGRTLTLSEPVKEQR